MIIIGLTFFYNFPSLSVAPTTRRCSTAALGRSSWPVFQLCFPAYMAGYESTGYTTLAQSGRSASKREVALTRPSSLPAAQIGSRPCSIASFKSLANVLYMTLSLGEVALNFRLEGIPHDIFTMATFTFAESLSVVQSLMIQVRAAMISSRTAFSGRRTTITYASFATPSVTPAILESIAVLWPPPLLEAHSPWCVTAFDVHSGPTHLQLLLMSANSCTRISHVVERTHA